MDSLFPANLPWHLVRQNSNERMAIEASERDPEHTAREKDAALALVDLGIPKTTVIPSTSVTPLSQANVSLGSNDEVVKPPSLSTKKKASHATPSTSATPLSAAQKRSGSLLCSTDYSNHSSAKK
eukprot:GHVP01042468.1.p1 GENE.GHVP01042468.1~~GHVP01042468.1.p1  ORF type:complete len:125 (-),score=23.15 GHVP01042468.1:1-375(-)